MGVAASALAVRCQDKDAVLLALRLKDTGIPVDQDRVDRYRGGAVTVLPSGWIYLIGGLTWFDERRLKRASRLGLAVSSSLEEHVMVSDVRAFADGAELWAVVHDGDQGLYHMEVRGEPPEPFAEIHEGLARQQQEEFPEAEDPEETAYVDYVMDAPLKLAEAVCGLSPNFMYRPDAPRLAFTTLKRIRDPKPTTPFWGRFKAGLRMAREAFRQSRAARR